MKILVAASLLALSTAAAAQTVHKYIDANGRTHYSNKPVPGAVLIDSLEYNAPRPPVPRPRMSASDAAGEARIRLQLSNLEAAWVETQVTGKALAVAEGRLAAGITPTEAEVLARGGPVAPPAAGPGPASPSSGGPSDAAPRSDGGPAFVAPPSAGGPMATRRGGGMRPEYRNRMAALEADVSLARLANQEAWRRYNLLR